MIDIRPSRFRDPLHYLAGSGNPALFPPPIEGNLRRFMVVKKGAPKARAFGLAKTVAEFKLVVYYVVSRLYLPETNSKSP